MENNKDLTTKWGEKLTTKGSTLEIHFNSTQTSSLEETKLFYGQAVRFLNHIKDELTFFLFFTNCEIL